MMNIYSNFMDKKNNLLNNGQQKIMAIKKYKKNKHKKLGDFVMILSIFLLTNLNI